ncbi:MAG: 2-amino-4-hydroxy-6-hydroxymethyldihydropteridine diphosphokinase [Acidobacteriota bacterium]|nr:2-amino-4-hydroxy-6-hydroxymethyldihydropteridine diphosphokinase [Acidobacteriota bacterium]MDE3266060.1 2-amino-4-hydroxy-6-hydroxymethyldihydropteridine diphosphokinase [Acidobacteriota bacterium]
MTRTRAFIALGSNLRPRSANLRTALGHLRRAAEVRSVSTFHRTEAVPERGVRATDPEFLNAAAAVETDVDAHTLLATLLGIEAALGRDRTATGPRAIDLDLLLFGDRIIDAPGLVLPHPRMHRRRFVLEPLVEIAPNAWHPGLLKTAAELLAALVPASSSSGGREPSRQCGRG